MELNYLKTIKMEHYSALISIKKDLACTFFKSPNKI